MHVEYSFRARGMTGGSFFLFLLLLMMVSGTAFAQDGVAVATIEKDRGPGIEKNIPPPVVTERYEYYDVTGSSEKELRCQMTQNGCTWNDGKKYDSVTSWNWKWDYGYNAAPRACSADSFTVTVEIIFRYPRWVRAGEVPRSLVEKWDDYLKKLSAHENVHRDMAVDAATELSRAVAGLPPASSCKDLDRAVRALAGERMKKLNAEEQRYDAATSHGITQGAVFP